MDLVPVLGAALASLLLSRVTGYRRAFCAGTAAGLLGWALLYASGHAVAWSAAAVVVAGFLGGLAATARATGIVEDNAPPPAAVRAAVMAHHRAAGVFPSPPRRSKRLFDVAVALVTVAVTAPLWVLVAMLVWLEEPGPVFFVKNSVGRGGGTFRQLKFRSMRYCAEEHSGPVISCPDDPRTLRVGRSLRRWHLDELPELLNVIAGTMSLVGPRPLRTVLVAGYLAEVPDFAERHAVQPGIACTAQIERYRMPPRERLHKDRAYIGSMSMRVDLMLLGRAVWTTVRGSRDRTEADGPTATRTAPAHAGTDVVRLSRSLTMRVRRLRPGARGNAPRGTVAAVAASRESAGGTP